MTSVKIIQQKLSLKSGFRLRPSSHRTQNTSQQAYMQMVEHTVINRSVHTACKQHQRICMQISMQICFRVLCERGQRGVQTVNQKVGRQGYFSIPNGVFPFYLRNKSWVQCPGTWASYSRHRRSLGPIHTGRGTPRTTRCKQMGPVDVTIA